MADNTDIPGALSQGLLGLSAASAVAAPGARPAPQLDPIIQALLGNAPSKEEVDTAKEAKQGALTRLRGAYDTSMRPENYSPFQEMVSTYLQNMVPGWNQYGLGRAAVAPYARQMAEAKTRHEEGIKEATTEMTNAEQEWRDISGRMRTGITAGASIGRKAQTLVGSKGKIINNALGPDGVTVGSWVVDGNGDPGDPEYLRLHGKFIPGVDNAATKLTTAALTMYGNAERQDPNAAQKAADYVLQTLKSQRPSAAGGAPVLPPQPLEELKSPVLSPGSAAPGFSMALDKLPPEGQKILSNLLARAESQPDNLALQRNTTKQIYELAKHFGMDNPQAVREVPFAGGEIDQRGLPPIGGEEPIPPPVGEPQSGGPAPQPLAAPSAPAVPSGGLPEPKVVDYRGIESDKSSGREEGTRGAKELEKQNQTYLSTSALKNQTGLMRQIAGVEGVPSGELAPQIQTLRSVMSSLGVPIDKNAVSAPQIFESFATQFALHQRIQNGENMLPGQMSNYEDKMLRSTVPMLSNTPEGRLALIDLMDAAATSNHNIAKAAIDYAKAHGNRLPPDWYTSHTALIDREMARMKLAYTKVSNKFGIKEQ